MTSTNNKLILIDADIVYHRAAFSCESKFDFGDTEIRTSDASDVADIFHNIVSSILSNCKSNRFILCWSGVRNFRHDLISTYKSNRAKVRRPVVDKDVLIYFKQRYPSAQVHNMEADDIMGITSGVDTIIASDDKDLLTVPGLHYKPRKPELGLIEVSLEDADKQWLKQTLMGDSTDGYKGIPGVGQKKSQKFLEEGGYTWETVSLAYELAGLSNEEALLNARLARILRPGEWNYTNNEPILWSPEEK
jgi:DNA polymerase-1